MDERKIVDILIGIHGPDALDVAKAEAEQYRAQGNDLAYKRALRRIKPGDQVFIRMPLRFLPVSPTSFCQTSNLKSPTDFTLRVYLRM